MYNYRRHTTQHGNETVESSALGWHEGGDADCTLHMGKTVPLRSGDIKNIDIGGTGTTACPHRRGCESNRSQPDKETRLLFSRF